MFGTFVRGERGDGRGKRTEGFGGDTHWGGDRNWVGGHTIITMTPTIITIIMPAPIKIIMMKVAIQE